MKFLRFWVILMLPVVLLAADYSGYHYELFFERQPSARANSMGQSLTALNDGAFTAWYNPAAVIGSPGSNGGYSQSSPYYLENDATHKYWGFSYEWEDYGTIGVSRYYVSLDGPIDVVLPNGETKKQETSFFSLSFARAIAPNLSLGLNINLYHQQTIQNFTLTAWPIDVGVLRSFPYNDDEDEMGNPGSFSVGAVIRNINRAKVGDAIYYGPYIQDGTFPSIFRVGAVWEQIFIQQPFIPGYFIPGIILTVEYENVLNSPHQSALKGGFELSFLDMAFVRMGYYSQQLDPDFTGGKESISDFTYGLGIKIDLNQFVEDEFPMVVRADYVQMEQPSFRNTLSNAEFSTLALQVQWLY